MFNPPTLDLTQHHNRVTDPLCREGRQTVRWLVCSIPTPSRKDDRWPSKDKDDTPTRTESSKIMEHCLLRYDILPCCLNQMTVLSIDERGKREWREKRKEWEREGERRSIEEKEGQREHPVLFTSTPGDPLFSKWKFPLRSKERCHQNSCFCYFMDTLGSLCHKAEGRESSPYPGSLIYPNDEQMVHSLHMWVERNGFALPVSLLPP